MKRQLFSHYDFVMIGDHPATLWGANLLLEKGLKVLVVPMGSDRSGNYAPRFALESLEIPKGDWIQRERNPIQILTPDRRFRVQPSPDSLGEECEFVYRKNLNAFEKLDPLLVRGLAYVDRGTETGPVSSGDWKKICQRVNDQIYFQKEPGWLKDRFLDQAKKLGGHVLPDGCLNRIFVEKRSFVGIQVEGSSSMITANRVLVGCNWNFVRELMSETVPLRSTPTGWWFEVRLKVSEDAIPVGLTSQMIWVQSESPVIEIEHLQRGEFVLRTVLPYADHTLERVEQRKISQRLLKVMEKVIPDLEYNLSRMVPDIRDPEKTEQVDLVELYPFHALGQIPSSKLVYSIPGLGHESPVQGMGFAYEEAYPQMGDWGAYFAVQQLIQEWAKSTQRLDLQRIDAPL